jgi:hypothetical protein
MKVDRRISADRRSMMWVMATLAAAMSLQLLRMPVWIMLVALAPMVWRVAA